MKNYSPPILYKPVVINTHHGGIVETDSFPSRKEANEAGKAMCDGASLILCHYVLTGVIAYRTTVRVYRNLHNNKYSVQRWESGKGWRVSCHVGLITLKNVVFDVNQKGREKVLREGRKNVHAFVYGEVTNPVPLAIPATYNPYKRGEFFRLDNDQPLHNAETATLGFANGKAQLKIAT